MTLSKSVQVSVHRRGSSRARAFGLICGFAGAVLAGCGTNEEVGTYLVDPGRYSFYHCGDLKTQLTVLLKRETELHNLIDKASEGGGGTVIGNLSYRAQYDDVLGQEKVLQRTAAEKNCDLAPPSVQSDQVVR
jgi:hypothetical protein